MNAKIDKETGEVLSDNREEVTAKSFTHFLSMLEDGQLNSELSTELQELCKEMEDHSRNYGSKAKGKVSITIDFALEKGIFEIFSKFKITKPETPRIRSIAWSDANGNFTPHNPRQQDMFKDVSTDKKVRKI